jgi:nucleotide-binding universal stress UspA family protein
VFSRVLVGMAPTTASQAAASQGALLVEADGTLELLAAFDPKRRDGSPPPIFLDVEPERELARERLADAARALPPGAGATMTIAPGHLADALVDELGLGHETCVVIPADAGSTVHELLRTAPCSVLVARPGPAGPPAAIVVGVDGSPESEAAYRVGRHVAERFGARLSALPGDALIGASSSADLVVVGGRGLRTA